MQIPKYLLKSKETEFLQMGSEFDKFQSCFIYILKFKNYWWRPLELWWTAFIPQGPMKPLQHDHRAAISFHMQLSHITMPKAESSHCSEFPLGKRADHQGQQSFHQLETWQVLDSRPSSYRT